jgi:hypothetical protein
VSSLEFLFRIISAIILTIIPALCTTSNFGKGRTRLKKTYWRSPVHDVVIAEKLSGEKLEDRMRMHWRGWGRLLEVQFLRYLNIRAAEARRKAAAEAKKKLNCWNKIAEKKEKEKVGMYRGNGQGPVREPDEKHYDWRKTKASRKISCGIGGVCF